MNDYDFDALFENQIANLYGCTVEEYWQREREYEIAREIAGGGSDHWCEPDADINHPF